MFIGSVAAFFVGEGYVLADPDQATRVCVFAHTGASWIEVDAVPFTLATEAMETTRACLRDLVDRLGACRVAVGRHVAGLPYQVLNRWGFSIFEAGAFSFDLLDRIAQDVEDARTAPVADRPCGPVPVDMNGTWFCDLVSLQEAHPETSSKMALRPFLARGEFVELKVRCSHVPPWFDRELPSMGLSYVAEMGGSELFVSISKAVVGAGADELLGRTLTVPAHRGTVLGGGGAQGRFRGERMIG